MNSNISNNSINEHGENELTSSVAYVILLLTAGIPALTNIFYIIVCFRIFSKEFFKLLILCLCLSGSIQGFSTVWFCILSLFKSALITPISCSFSIFLMYFGLVSSYGFLFILNLVSYLTIRSFNFGVRQKLEKMKLPLLSGVLIGSICISCVTWIIPHRPTIKTCSTVTLFAENLNLFVAIAIGVVNILLWATFITSTISICQIYNTFFKAKVGPENSFSTVNIQNTEASEIDTECNSESRCRMSDISLHIFSITDLSLQENDRRTKTTGCNKNMAEIDPVERNEVSDVIASEGRNIPNHPAFMRRKISNSFGIASGSRKISNPETSVSRKIAPAKNKSIVHQKNKTFARNFLFRQARHSLPLTQKKTVKTADGDLTGPGLNRTNSSLKWNSWEVNAFVTNLVITITTIILTGPFIGLSTLGLVTDQISYGVGFFAFILLNFNTAMSPFVFAWRIPEIRQQLKNVCNKN